MISRDSRKIGETAYSSSSWKQQASAVPCPSLLLVWDGEVICINHQLMEQHEGHRFRAGPADAIGIRPPRLEARAEIVVTSVESSQDDDLDLLFDQSFRSPRHRLETHHSAYLQRPSLLRRHPQKNQATSPNQHSTMANSTLKGALAIHGGNPQVRRPRFVHLLVPSLTNSSPVSD